MAAQWYRKAAAQQDITGECEYGRCLAHGLGVPKDLLAARKHLQLAMNHGSVSARLLLRQLPSSDLGSADLHAPQIISNSNPASSIPEPLEDFVQRIGLSGTDISSFLELAAREGCTEPAVYLSEDFLSHQHLAALGLKKLGDRVKFIGAAKKEASRVSAS